MGFGNLAADDAFLNLRVQPEQAEGVGYSGLRFSNLFRKFCLCQLKLVKQPPVATRRGSQELRTADIAAFERSCGLPDRSI